MVYWNGILINFRWFLLSGRELVSRGEAPSFLFIPFLRSVGFEEFTSFISNFTLHLSQLSDQRRIKTNSK